MRHALVAALLSLMVTGCACQPPVRALVDQSPDDPMAAFEDCMDEAGNWKNTPTNPGDFCNAVTQPKGSK